MSPRLQFQGPARQRGAIGLMAAVTLGVALLFMLVVVDTGRLYLEQRKLQRVADTAALEAVSRGGQCLAGASAAAFAKQSASRNGFVVDADSTLVTTCGVLQTGVNNVRTFAVDASQSQAIRVIVSDTVGTSLSAGIRALFSPGPLNLNTRLTAVAVAAAPLPPSAQLSIRSTLLDVSLLNPLFTALLGSTVNLSVVSWQGLLSAHINLLDYLDQLAIDLNVSAGDYTQLLAADATIADFIQAAATVAQANGASAGVVTSLNVLKSAAISPAILHLGDLLKLQTGGPPSGFNADLNVFQLVQGFAQFANGKNGVAVDMSVGGGVTAKIRVIEPPQFSVIGNPALAKLDPMGANRIYVRTAQVRVLVTLDLSLVTNLVSVITNTLSLVSAPLGLDVRVFPEPKLDVSLEAGGGSSHVTDYSCVSDTNKSLTVSATTEVARLRVGRVNANWASSSSPLAVSAFPLLDIRHPSCPGCAYAGGGAEVMIDVPVAPKTATYSFINPPNVGLPGSEPPYVLKAEDALKGMSEAVTGVKLTKHAPTFNPGVLFVLFNTLIGLLDTVENLLASTLSGILSPLLDGLVNNLLMTLGIEVGKVEVSANLTCGQTGKAYLVI